MIIPTWDLFISLLFIVLVIYGLALGKERILALLISCYIGLIVSTVWGGALYNFFTGQSSISQEFWIKTNTSIFTIKTIVFTFIVLFLTIKGDFLKKAEATYKGIFSIVISGIYAFFSAGLILTSLASFLPEAEKLSIIDQSHIADLIIKYQTFWIVLPALFMILFGFINKEEEE